MLFMNEDSLSERQMINVELANRSLNTKSKDIIKDHVPKEHQEDLLLDFRCECSDPNCAERVPLTLKEYEKLHSNQARFVIAKNHEAPKVEKVRKQTKDFTIVEKYAL